VVTRRRAARLIPAVAILATVLLATVGRADAQADLRGKDQLSLLQYEGSGSRQNGRTNVEYLWSGPAEAVRDTKVTENGHPVKLDGAPVKATGDRAMVYVVDSGPGMDDADLLPAVREQIMKSVAEHPGVRWGIVQAGDRAEMKADITTDVGRLKGAVDSIGPTKTSAIWNGVNQAAAMFADRPSLQANVMLITADNDTVNPANAPVARSTIVSNAVEFSALTYTGPRSAITDTAEYAAVQETHTGRWAPVDGNAALLASIDNWTDVVADQQFRATYTSTVPDGEPVHVVVEVGGVQVTADVLAGRGLYKGYQQLHPELGVSQTTLPFAENKAALALALLLALGAVAGLAYAVSTTLLQQNLSNMLQPYADAYGLIDGESNSGEPNSLTKSALVQRAVALTEQVAENQGFLTRAEAALERANLPLRAGEALFFYLVIIVVVTIIPLMLSQNIMVGLICGVLGALIPVSAVNYIAKKRRKAFLGQLPDTLSLLSGTLKAGYSLSQGFEAVSQEVPEPMGLELRRVMTESRLGRPLEESLESSAERMNSPDFAWAVMAIRIQREVGGNLAELLLTVADTMVARERLRRDVASLTAEGRVSAYMLAFMPPALAGVMYVLNKEYVSTLFTEMLGMVMVGLAATSMVIGFLWMRKIIDIEI
jgi:tight adherence protein B